MTRKIIQNEVQCDKCKQIIWSGSVHDFKSCRCGSVAVDGGMQYLRRVFSDPTAPYTDRSMMIDSDVLEELKALIKEKLDNDVPNVILMIAILKALKHNDMLDISGIDSNEVNISEAVTSEIQMMKDTGRNSLGILLGVIRTLRELKLLNMEKFEVSYETQK